MATLRVESRSRDETLQLGRDVGRRLRPGDVVRLRGRLGAGKSVLARGIGEALGTPVWRGSPTYNLVHEYPTRPALYHADLYRLRESDLADLGLEELAEDNGILLVEWPERAESDVASLPARRFVDLSLTVTGEESRIIDIAVPDDPDAPRA
ncbi:MAG TPA: tRNA (adenosine(37)-N6)-threonylcarbamoyltransferase complex ATPase subunit type 1 TsaE [Chloroflexota bacterium]|nr:tRNA (adenosine(37)-N6)-threonylcarbamoyltransferase complex ATPase subunit type 1 TsaE [Chloroflexota bacterium]